MYSEISACPCHPLARITSHLLLRYNYAAPYLNHSRGYFCGPAASALLSTLFLIVTLAATTLLLSMRARSHTHARSVDFFFLSLSSFLPSSVWRTSESSKEKQSREGRLSDWIVSSIYTTFGSPGFPLLLFLSFLFPLPWTSRHGPSTYQFRDRGVLGS